MNPLSYGGTTKIKLLPISLTNERDSGFVNAFEISIISGIGVGTLDVRISENFVF